MKRPALIGVSAACLALAVSCVLVMDPDRPTTWQPQGEFRKTVEFASGSVLSLEIGSGDVEIVGGEAETLQVTARGPAGFPAKGRGIRIYGAWNHRPAMDVQKTANGYRVRTRALDGPGPPPRTDVRIRVPHSVLIEDIRTEDGDVSISDTFGRAVVSLGRGNVTVRNFSGPVDISVGTGSVDVEALDVRDGDSLRITTGSGDIVLRLEPGAGARIEARAPNGVVRSDFDLGVTLPAPEVSGQTGSGGANIVLETREGNIDILLVKEVKKDHG